MLVQVLKFCVWRLEVDEKKGKDTYILLSNVGVCEGISYLVVLC